jgi:hypothetical protein
MKDATRFALAIAAILSATALDAEQFRSSRATDREGFVPASPASPRHAVNAPDHAANENGRPSPDEPRWIADQTIP